MPGSPYSLIAIADIVISSSSSNSKHKVRPHTTFLFFWAPLGHMGHCIVSPEAGSITSAARCQRDPCRAVHSRQRPCQHGAGRGWCHDSA